MGVGQRAVSEGITKPTPLRIASVAAQSRGIPPLFKADAVDIAVSASKDGKLRVVYAGWDDAKVVLPDEVLELRASSQGGGGADLTPPRGSADPPLKNEDPPSDPPVSPAIGAAHVHPIVHLSPSFLRSRYA